MKKWQQLVSALYSVVDDALKDVNKLIPELSEIKPNTTIETGFSTSTGYFIKNPALLNEGFLCISKKLDENKKKVEAYTSELMKRIADEPLTPEEEAEFYKVIAEMIAGFRDALNFVPPANWEDSVKQLFSNFASDYRAKCDQSLPSILKNDTSKLKNSSVPVNIPKTELAATHDVAIESWDTDAGRPRSDSVSSESSLDTASSSEETSSVGSFSSDNEFNLEEDQEDASAAFQLLSSKIKRNKIVIGNLIRKEKLADDPSIFKYLDKIELELIQKKEQLKISNYSHLNNKLKKLKAKAYEGLKSLFFGEIEQFDKQLKEFVKIENISRSLDIFQQKLELNKELIDKDEYSKLEQSLRSLKTKADLEMLRKRLQELMAPKNFSKFTGAFDLLDSFQQELIQHEKQLNNYDELFESLKQLKRNAYIHLFKNEEAQWAAVSSFIAHREQQINVWKDRSLSIIERELIKKAKELATFEFQVKNTTLEQEDEASLSYAKAFSRLPRGWITQGNDLEAIVEIVESEKSIEVTKQSVISISDAEKFQKARHTQENLGALDVNVNGSEVIVTPASDNIVKPTNSIAYKHTSKKVGPYYGLPKGPKPLIYRNDLFKHIYNHRTEKTHVEAKIQNILKQHLGEETVISHYQLETLSREIQQQLQLALLGSPREPQRPTSVWGFIKSTISAIWHNGLSFKTIADEYENWQIGKEVHALEKEFNASQASALRIANGPIVKKTDEVAVDAMSVCAPVLTKTKAANNTVQEQSEDNKNNKPRSTLIHTVSRL